MVLEGRHARRGKKLESPLLLLCSLQFEGSLLSLLLVLLVGEKGKSEGMGGAIRCGGMRWRTTIGTKNDGQRQSPRLFLFAPLLDVACRRRKGMKSEKGQKGVDALICIPYAFRMSRPLLFAPFGSLPAFF